jgi:hypothetical protein
LIAIWTIKGNRLTWPSYVPTSLLVGSQLSLGLPKVLFGKCAPC